MKTKTHLIVCLFSLISIFSYAQTSSGTWDSSTATYINNKHGISWKLIDDIEWLGRPILSDGTLFKVRNDDTQIMVMINATPFNGSVKDVWKTVSQIKTVRESGARMLAKNKGMQYLSSSVQKCTFKGKHALRCYWDMEKVYPNQIVHTVDISYGFVRGNYTYVATVSALSVLEEEIDLFEEIATELFNGLIIK